MDLCNIHKLNLYGGTVLDLVIALWNWVRVGLVQEPSINMFWSDTMDESLRGS